MQDLQDKSDVFNILRESVRLNFELDNIAFEYKASGSFQRNLYLRASRGFWNDVQSDMPWQLDEGIRSDF